MLENYIALYSPFAKATFVSFPEENKASVSINRITEGIDPKNSLNSIGSFRACLQKSPANLNISIHTYSKNGRTRTLLMTI